MKLSIFQKGFNFSQDGPGNRLVYHLAGCSLCCPWCSNPEGKAHGGGKEVTVEEVAEEALRSQPMFFSGGGVTLTGGEVTEQWDAVAALLKRLKEEGIHTCIETNGTHPRLPQLSSLVDYLIMDLKHYDDARHREIIGCTNRTVLENIRQLGSCREQLTLRIPLIGGFNSSVEDALGFAETLENLGVKDRVAVELLCYHEYGKDKYRTLGLDYPMTDRAKISPQTLAAFDNVLRQHEIRIITS